jgi:hypothetical protein
MEADQRVPALPFFHRFSGFPETVSLPQRGNPSAISAGTMVGDHRFELWTR